MKISGLRLMACITATIVFCSCDKENSFDKENVAVNINVQAAFTNQEYYYYQLPDGEFEIISPALHATESGITENAEGRQYYHYLSEAGYSGNDKVVIGSRPNHHDTPGSHLHGSCNSGNSSRQYAITISMNISNQVSNP